MLGLVVIVAIGLPIAARALKRKGANAAQDRGAALVHKAGGNLPVSDKARASLQTVVDFGVPSAVATSALSSTKPPMFWDLTAPGVWSIIQKATQNVAQVEIARATVIDLPEGTSRLHLEFMVETVGMTPHEPDWRKLRSRFAKAATTAGISATEAVDPTFDRVAVQDGPSQLGTNETPLYRWVR